MLPSLFIKASSNKIIMPPSEPTWKLNQINKINRNKNLFIWIIKYQLSLIKINNNDESIKAYFQNQCKLTTEDKVANSSSEKIMDSYDHYYKYFLLMELSTKDFDKKFQ